MSSYSTARPRRPALLLPQLSRPAWLLAALLPYTAVVYAAAVRRDVVTNLDFWYHTAIGERLNWFDWRTLVHGYYPLGYPLVLHLGSEAGIDALRLAQALSWLGSLLALAAVFGLASGLVRRWATALAGVLLLATNINFINYAAQEGNDLPAAGLQLLAVLLLWRFAPAADDHAARRRALAAGAVLGLGYLVRYTALVLLPIAVVYVLWRAGRPLHRAAGFAGLFLLAFALASAVQTVPSLVVHGTPFYNLQAKNVWFGLYGQYDWVRHWTDVPDTISLRDVIAQDPARFVTHWAAQAWQSLGDPGTWPATLRIAWLLGFALVLADRSLRPAQRALFALALFGSVAAVALAWASPRFLLVPLCLEAAALARVIDVGTLWLERRRVPAIAAGVATLGVCALLAAPGFAPLAGWLGADISRAPYAVTALLRSAGMQDPGEVMTNDPLLHATDVAARARYAQTWFFAPYPATLGELLDVDVAAHWRYGEYVTPPTRPGETAAQHWRYLVLNYAAGFGHYRPIEQIVLQSKSRLVPLSVDESATVLCVQPCMPGSQRNDDWLFDNGMRLLGHAVIPAGGRVGVYLTWQADRAVERSYKVSVRALDSQGKMLAQVDGIPQAWTYPTDQWTPGERIVDFYALGPLPGCASGCRLALVVYDAETGAPVPARTGLGVETAPEVPLDSLPPSRSDSP